MTEHELFDTPVVIGRDPQCELFFADRKLSRHHARIERNGSQFTLVDLGSRNGSWVNEERIEQRVLQSGDSIRLGGLKISFEPDAPPASEHPEEATTYLSTGGASPDDSSTVILGAPGEARPDATVALNLAPSEEPPTPDETSTVILSDLESATEDYADETLERPPSPDSTVVLSGEPREREHDTGAMLLDAEADPGLVPRPAADITTDFAVETTGETDPGTATPFYTPDVSEGGGIRQATTRSWSLRFALIAASMAVLAFLVLALPLMRTLGNALVEESKLRGQALLDVLAASNESALGEARVQDVSVSRVVHEAGVRSAYVVDGKGGLLAPVDDGRRVGEALRLDGVEVDFARLTSLTELEASNGDYVVAKPITYRGRNVGAAVVRYRLRRGSSSWTMLVLLLGSLLMAVGVGAAVLVAKRITLSPLRELSEDVAALRDGQASELSVERPYGELSMLARNLNDLLQSRVDVSERPPEDVD